MGRDHRRESLSNLDQVSPSCSPLFLFWRSPQSSSSTIPPCCLRYAKNQIRYNMRCFEKRSAVAASPGCVPGVNRRMRACESEWGFFSPPPQMSTLAASLVELQSVPQIAASAPAPHSTSGKALFSRLSNPTAQQPLSKT